ncbi:YbgC/FadM family acyl-CoA thioesterase, partial [Citrobacter freundii]|uniref:YbgC/FadM family acyl-CoA thioesterase n=1 Tax=Citrobacter freundii TaxID=546 RepID=UPI0024E0C9E8
MQTQIKVRGFHLDVYQHVNNARYLEFLEEARWDGLENSDSFQWMTAHNIAFVVVNININYRRPAVLSDLLTITSCLDSWDHVPMRSWPLFKARHVLRTL